MSGPSFVDIVVCFVLNIFHTKMYQNIIFLRKIPKSLPEELLLVLCVAFVPVFA